MLSYRYLLRTLPSSSMPTCAYNIKLRLASSSSSTSSSSDDERPKKKTQKLKEPQKAAEPNAESINKLNMLLQQMVSDDIQKKEKLKLAKPGSLKSSKSIKSDDKDAKTRPIGEQILDATKTIAAAIGGNTKQTESELLNKLLNPYNEHGNEQDKQKPASLSDIIVGMKVDRTKAAAPSQDTSRAHQVRQIMNRNRESDSNTTGERRRPRTNIWTERRTPNQLGERIDLFGAEPLGIFSPEKFKIQRKEDDVNKTWAELEKRELRLAVTHPPSNYYQQMILWTQQGKLWTFPIDNEQAIGDEKDVYFADHIFLEQHLEAWCPKQGPIRHFMELVCVGLSKNPYITVQNKKDHIEWYKNYFLDKKQLLQEIGAFPNETVQNVKHLDKP